MARALTQEEKDTRKKAYTEKFCREIGCDVQHAILFYDNSVKTRLDRELAFIKRLIDKFGVHAAEVYLDREWTNTLISIYIQSKESRGLEIFLRRTNAILKGKLFQQRFLPHIPNMSILFKIAMHHELNELLAITRVQNIEKRRRQIQALIDSLKELEKKE